MTTRCGFVSTYPPTQCGLATFTASLREAIVGPGSAEGWVVRLVEAPQQRSADEVVAQWVMEDPGSLTNAVARLNECDVVIVQHEYGVYGGRDGDEILLLLDELRVPSIVVLHTVLTAPTRHQRHVLESVVAKADAVVTMTETARQRLAAGYRVDLGKVCIIAHGAPSAPAANHPTTPFRSGRFTILTWGLLGPGKGIEWAIAAMARLRDLDPMPRYVVAGQTHPKVLLHEGEAYRSSLAAQVRELGLANCIDFDSHYRDATALGQLVRAADVVLLPYDSTEQVTSGVLIEAVAAGKPVIATRFPHARELLAAGAGLVVPHRDPGAIADALRAVITRRGLAASMSNAASATAPQLLWPSVAAQYRELASRLISARMAA